MTTRVLVIDDDEDLLAVIAALLRSEDIEPTCYADPQEALKVFDQPWSLLLTDLMMPGLSGVEVVRRFRKADAQIPIIVLSQCQREAMIMQAYAAGANDYVAKPFEPQALLFRVQLWLEEASLLSAPAQDPHTLLFSELDIEKRLAEGNIDFERFALRKLLGQGSGGVVYEAQEHSSGRRVALKILDPGLTIEPDIIPRFLRERDTLANVRHPNIVSLYEIGYSQGLYFYSMELVEGPALRELLAQQGGIDEAQLLEISRDVCAALAHLHSMGIVHRDIKPGNILLPVGRAKLVDFGLAKHCEDGGGLTSNQVILGTPGYLAPEEILGASPGFPSDIYGLGITMVEMALGELPFSGDSTRRIIDRTVNNEPGHAFGAEAVLSAELAELVQSMIHRQPENRPSAQQVHDRVCALLAAGG